MYYISNNDSLNGTSSLGLGLQELYSDSDTSIGDSILLLAVFNLREYNFE